MCEVMAAFTTLLCLFPHANLISEIEISRRVEDGINRIFLDPTGNHLLVGMENGDNYYLHSRSVRPKKLPKWQVG